MTAQMAQRLWRVSALVILGAAMGLILAAVWPRKPVYEATAIVQAMRPAPTIVTDDFEAKGQQIIEQVFSTAKSEALFANVAKRLRDEQFVAPYADFELPKTYEALRERCDILFEKRTAIIYFVCHASNPDLAARLANLFADELINLSVKQRIEAEMQALEALQEKTVDLRKDIEAIRLQISKLGPHIPRIPVELETQEEARLKTLRQELEEKQNQQQLLMSSLQTENAGGLRLYSPIVRIIDKATPEATRLISHRREYAMAGGGCLMLAGILGWMGRRNQ